MEPMSHESDAPAAQLSSGNGLPAPNADNGEGAVQRDLRHPVVEPIDNSSCHLVHAIAFRLDIGRRYTPCMPRCTCSTREAIVRAQFTIELIASYAYLWPYPVGAVALFMFLRMRNSLRGRISALQGAAWELVRRMENTTPDGVRERARVAESTTEKFAVDGNAKIPRSAMFSGDAATSDLTAAGHHETERGNAREDGL